MAARIAKNPEDYIYPLYMNGMAGRMLCMPASRTRKREILLVYGHHASLERLFGIAQYLNKYGRITAPDLPGFGGMQPFYKIGEKPCIDNLADYLAAFIKLRYRNRRLTIVGMSLGFAVVTRMLQKYPEIAKKVDYAISICGFVNKNDFKLKKRTTLAFRWGAFIFSSRLAALMFRYLALQGPLIRAVYKLGGSNVNHPKFKNMSDDEYRKMIDFEIHLWQCNDTRTYMDTTITMFTLNLLGQHIDLPVYHVAVDNDKYFDDLVVEQHMRAIYKDFDLIKSKMPAHAPTVVATMQEAAPFVPPKIRQLLNKRD